MLPQKRTHDCSNALLAWQSDLLIAAELGPTND
jgi:hypothetical protein